MITLSAEWLAEHWALLVDGRQVALPLSCWDGGDAYTLRTLGPMSSPVSVEGRVVLGHATSVDAPVIVCLRKLPTGTGSGGAAHFTAPDGFVYAIEGLHVTDGQPERLDVQVVSVLPALELRRSEIIESNLLHDSCVVVIGLGTGGVHVALELAKAGVAEFLLVDPDRLEVGNVARHHAGISQSGRRKVYAARDMLLEKNPAARVESYPVRATWETEDVVRSLIRRADVVICATDGRASKLFINRICFEEGTPALYGGAFRRAYAGEVLRVRPGQSPCYQCLVLAKPQEEADQEISSEAQAAEIAYSDRPVAIEPGLALDVAPIALMVAKLALQELLIGKETTLRALDRDLAAPWYRWANRPEAGTWCGDWPPLSESVDENTILRWYGIYLERDPGCPVCGDFGATYGVGAGESPPVPELPFPGSKEPKE